MTSLLHLVRRALTSFSNRTPAEVGKADFVLNSDEMKLWRSMPGRDQTHSLVVLSRFEELCPEATRSERAAALLHDLGKTRSGLGWLMRIVATIVGSRGARFTEYHDHERIGAEMLMNISDPRTIDLVGGSTNDPIAGLLRAADEI